MDTEDEAQTLTIRRGTWHEMRRAILLHELAQHGSVRAAAKVLNVPRSTLGVWITRGA